VRAELHSFSLHRRIRQYHLEPALDLAGLIWRLYIPVEWTAETVCAELPRSHPDRRREHRVPREPEMGLAVDG